MREGHGRISQGHPVRARPGEVQSLRRPHRLPAVVPARRLRGVRVKRFSVYLYHSIVHFCQSVA